MIYFPQMKFDAQRVVLTSKDTTPRLMTKLFVILQGIPAIGKSTVVSKLTNVTILEQDQFKGSGKMCFNACKKLLETLQSGVVLLCRNNACLEQYDRYLDLCKTFEWKILVISPQEMETCPSFLLKICIKSAIDRFGHPTFDSLSPREKENVVRKFHKQFRFPNDPRIDFFARIKWLTFGRRREVEDIVMQIQTCIAQHLK